MNMAALDGLRIACTHLSNRRYSSDQYLEGNLAMCLFEIEVPSFMISRLESISPYILYQKGTNREKKTATQQRRGGANKAKV